MANTKSNASPKMLQIADIYMSGVFSEHIATGPLPGDGLHLTITYNNNGVVNAHTSPAKM